VPYIKAEDRIRLALDYPRTAGELNYLLTLRIKKEFTDKGQSYAVFNDIVAAIELVKIGQASIGLAADLEDIMAMYLFATNDLPALEERMEPPTEEELVILGQRGVSALGAIECAKLEFIRRVVSPYEDAKIVANGDVY